MRSADPLVTVSAVARDHSAGPTEDLDFFTSPELGHVPAARDALEVAARERGWRTERIHDSDTFCRLVIRSGTAETLTDFAVDAPPDFPASLTSAGPTLAPEELAGRPLHMRRFGGATAHHAPEPVPSLARLFSRPPSSVLAKMANLDGSRSHGGKWDILAGAMLRDDPAHFTHVYRVLLSAARAEGIGEDRLPDFLGLEYGGELDLLGQDELETSTLEAAFKEQIAQRASEDVWSEKQTEQIILAAARVGQHVFAVNVLSNCGKQCVFCGLKPFAFRRQAHAGSWTYQALERQRAERAPGSSERPGRLPRSRRRLRHGATYRRRGAADPFSKVLANAVRGDPLARQYYGRPPLLERLLLPEDAQPPARKYLDWHKTKVFIA